MGEYKMSTQQMRTYISTKYDSLKWKDRVQRMSDRQVCAVYLSMKKRKAKKPEETNCEQLRLF